MTVKTIIRFTLVWILFGAGECFGAGTTGMAALLNNIIAARPLGMGNAYTAASGDGNCLWFNPGALGGVLIRELLLSYSRGLTDDNYGTLTYMDRYREHNFGVGIVTLDAGIIEINNADGTSSKVRAEQDYGVVAGYGRRLSRYFSAGGSIKLLNSRLAEEADAMAYAIDVGCYYKASDKSSYGVSVQNFGTDVTYRGGVATGDAKDPLPLTVRLGGATDLMPGPKHKLTGVLDLVKQIDDNLWLRLGFEYWYKSFFAVRVGYRGEYLLPYVGGFGVKSGDYQIDYAAAFMGSLGISHYLTLGMRL